MKLERPTIFAILVTFFLTAAVVGGTVWYWRNPVNKEVSKATSNLNNANPTADEVRMKELEDENVLLRSRLDLSEKVKTYVFDNNYSSTMKIFSSKNIGISFVYPAKLGSVELTVRPGGDTGTTFRGSFSATDKVTFGGIDPEFAEGRDGTFLDTQGYQISAGKYYFKFVSANPIVDPMYLLEPLEVLNVRGQNILLLDQNSFVSSRGVTDGPALQIGTNSYGALVNLKGSTFPGFAFWDMDSKTLKLNELKELIQSIKFL